MKRLKTYEILKMIDENKDEMVGKRYVQVSGLLQDGFNLGDIAVVTEYCGITSLGSEKHSKIRLSWNGFEEWEEVKEPVTWKEAFEAGLNGKKIKPIGQYLTYSKFQNIDFAIMYLAERPGYFRKIMLDDWYIE